MYPRTFFEEHPESVERGSCFALMPFADEFDSVFAAIQAALEGAELSLTVIRADEIYGAGHIMRDILEHIARAEIILADVTNRNANVFYELGIAHTVKDMGAVFILTQNEEDVPFDLRPFRYIRYEASESGLSQLQEDLITSIREVSGRAYRFSVESGSRYQFEHRLMGQDRAFYDFEILELISEEDVAKFLIRERRYLVGRPAEALDERGYGLERGGHVDLAAAPWRLILEESSQTEARFRVARL